MRRDIKVARQYSNGVAAFVGMKPAAGRRTSLIIGSHAPAWEKAGGIDVGTVEPRDFTPRSDDPRGFSARRRQRLPGLAFGSRNRADGTASGRRRDQAGEFGRGGGAGRRLLLGRSGGVPACRRGGERGLRL